MHLIDELKRVFLENLDQIQIGSKSCEAIHSNGVHLVKEGSKYV